LVVVFFPSAVVVIVVVLVAVVVLVVGVFEAAPVVLATAVCQQLQQEALSPGSESTGPV